MPDWVIHQQHGKLTYEPANYDIDLRAITSRDDVKVAINRLKREPFATEQIVHDAQEMLANFLVWVQAQQRVKRVRSSADFRQHVNGTG
ncbi:MAG TPA: hypothetical protein VHD36_03940 [Pirellulales bacterium]|nr:hypothetical protein [Pirellulales bacterium]